jgi:hypothetical protein
MRIIGLITLKPETTAQGFEDWTRSDYLPGIRALVSVVDFELLRTSGQFGSDVAAPATYVAVLDIADIEEFERDLGGDAGTALTTEFRRLAGLADWIKTERIGI